MARKSRPQRTVDMSAVPLEKIKANLESDLQRAVSHLIDKEMTIGFAIHILETVDANPRDAEQKFDSSLINVIEQFRGRIAELSNGRVKSPRQHA